MDLTGVFSLVGVIVGAAIPLVRDLLLSKNQRRIEIIKLHDKEKMDAYRHLLKYSKGLSIVAWPDNDRVYSDFITDCKNDFSKLVEYYPYYSEAIMKILDRIENLYHATIIDVEWVHPPRETIEKELPDIARTLYKQVITDFKKWRY